VNDQVSENIKVNDLGTTYGGGMLAMAAVSATLEAIEADGLLANARLIEAHLRDSLAGSNNVTAIHGKGCLLGIEFSEPAAAIHAKLLKHQIITGTSTNSNVLRLLPPLCVSADEIDLFVEVLSN
jgi:acetylornithine/succinyldiaminopimelate/putrescine aminotransferase